MRLVHTADWHLAYRSGTRLTPTGINRREADVAGTFARMIDQIIALAPDVVLGAGDLFDRVNPGNPAITHAFAQLARLRAALPKTAIVLIGGNHECPREAGQGCILPLFANLGIHVVDRSIERINVGEDLCILAVPDAPGLVRPPKLEPDPAFRFNVALIHGEVEGMPVSSEAERKAIKISREQLGLDEDGLAAWDYVALGHYHIAHEISPRCWYSGSIDFTSTSIWKETGKPKGFIERNLLTGVHTFHELAPSRAVIDLPVIDAGGLGADELDARIRETTEGSALPIDGAIVRLVVHNVTKEVGRGLDQRALRKYRTRALNFTLTLERPELAPRQPLARTYAELRNRSLEDILGERLASRQLPSDVDGGRLTQVAAEYLAKAKEQDSARSTTAVTELPTITTTEQRLAS